MYNESGFSVKNFILKVILVVLFVFLLMWLFPMPNLKPVFDRLYTENLATMKDAAKSYYTVDRLPKEVNQTVRMTLNEMLTMKLVLPIADSNDELCDGEASYVEIMKTDTEYVVKTNLACKTKTDYIVEHMGCYNLCSDQCGKKEEVVKPQTNPIKPVSYTTQYELKRTWYKGYTTNTTAAKTQYKHVKYETQAIFDGYTYTCPSGYGDREGTTCYKYVRDNDYYCDEGTLVGTQCKVTDTTYTYTCPSGYTKSGTGSNTICTGVVSTTGHYECSEGTLSGSQCKISSTTTAYACPTGYTKSGTGSSTTCSKVTSTTSESYYGTGQGKSIPSNTSVYRYVSTGSTYVKDCSSCASYLVYTYKIYKTTTTSNTVYATPTSSSSTTYTYKPAEWVVAHNTITVAPTVSTSTSTSYVPADRSTSTMTYTKPAIKTAQYDYVTVIVDSKWTYNATEPGYTMVDKKTIAGNTSTVYTPDWVLTLPAGYKQTDSKVEYKWSYYKTETGWTFTGKTRQVKK